MKTITETYSVAPQISAEDVKAIAQAGFKRVICNRPDAEVPPSHQSAAIEAAVRAEGLDFAILPLTHQTMTPENVQKQAELVNEADGPVLAYCASGTRCTVVWALGAAAEHGSDAVIARAAEAGYDIAGMKPVLDLMSKQG
ncbi:MAG: TIGR01244 family sulfur transferase [Pelagimonas sp.]|jgi:uncharacterized protein (TIGR01244 family)|nr:TIGR01244 family sulfur transferase [Pelagimonas sp.]